MSVSPGRLGAARALLAVEDGAHLEDALAEHAPAKGADRDLAWFLAFGVQRRRGHVDAALRPVLDRPLAALDAPVRVALRVGAFESLFARTPRHAAVHQAVEVARALGARRAHGLVNAVLRRLNPPTGLARADDLDHPAWLVDRWDRRYGLEATERWCRANSEPPPLFVVAKTPGATVPEASAPAGVEGVYRVTADRPIPELAGFREGQWWVQDLASVEVADLVPAGEGTRVLDACAAPGGKSFRLASKGAAVLAVDKDRERLATVEEGARRLALPVATARHDWTRGPMPGEFEAVLVDAPCTGLGTVRRHPEIRWRRSERDLGHAKELQQRILAAASAGVRPGGALVYAVCSPEPEEGEEVVMSFLAEHPSFTREATLSTAPPDRERAGSDPARRGEDAHFAVRMRRSA